jgi:imidazolonepropionase-like amidohydrolase
VDLPANGRLKEGFAADFLIVEGDPVADIGRVADQANHRAVIKDGRPAKGAAKLAGGFAAFDVAAAF